jgi:hypothetical protein
LRGSGTERSVTGSRADSRSRCREEGRRPHERREPERWRPSLEVEAETVQEPVRGEAKGRIFGGALERSRWQTTARRKTLPKEGETPPPETGGAESERSSEAVSAEAL